MHHHDSPMQGGPAVAWGRVATFYALACIGPVAAAVARAFLELPQLAVVAVTASAMVAPLLATVVMQRIDGRRPLDGLATVRASRWLLAAALLPVIVVLTTLPLSLAMPGATYDPTLSAFLDALASQLGPEQLDEARAQLADLPGGALGLVLLSIPQALVFGSTINALFAFGEEVGWRGWLQQQLAPLGIGRASLVTGLLWGLWHAPLILAGHNFDEHRVAGIGVFTVVCVALSPALALVRERAGTVWAAAVFHGVFNAMGAVPMLVIAGHELLVGSQAIAGAIAAALVSAAVALGTRRTER